MGHLAGQLVLDHRSPSLAARDADTMLDSFLFAGNTPLVRDVISGGARLHPSRRGAHRRRYRRVVTRLAGVV